MINTTTYQRKPLRERQRAVCLIVDRMRSCYQLTNNDALAQYLQLSSRAVTDWQNMGRIPMEYIFQCHFDTGVSLDWLIQINPPALLISSNPNVIKELAGAIAKELQYGLRDELIVAHRDDSIKVLANYLSMNVFAWINLQIQQSWSVDNLLGPSRQSTASSAGRISIR